MMCRRFERTVLLACASLLLLVAAHTQSCADVLVQSGYEFLSPYPADSGAAACHDEGDADGVPACSGEDESPARKGMFLSLSSSRTRPDAKSAVDSVSAVSATEARSPDWDGVWRDTGILFSSQVVAGGVIFALPESFSSWSNEQKKNGFKKYADNVVDPVIDKDDAYINYALHPYWGATYYIRARERGLDKVPSFIYSAFISAMYEFGVECFFEKPSIQDLVVTPVGGSLLGALVFEPVRDSIKRKQELSWYDHVALVLTDPVGVLSLGFEKMFGIKSTIMVNYSVPQMQKGATGAASASKNSRIGVVMQFPFDY